MLRPEPRDRARTSPTPTRCASSPGGSPRLAELRPGGRGGYAEVDRHGWRPSARSTCSSTSSAEYDAAKLARSAVEYSDQVALALQIVRKQPRVVAELRDRYRVVLLDEYQDTSVVQTWLLAELFAGHPVMAVGDPNQSIYGWRGRQRGEPRAVRGAVRRDRARLRAVDELAQRPPHPRRRERARRAVRRPRRGCRSSGSTAPEPRRDLPVDVVFAETSSTRPTRSRRWLADRLATGPARRIDAAGAAMLFRARKTQPFFLAALREHGVPFHVLGIGGLLAEPEIADLVSVLVGAAAIRPPGSN